MKNVDKLLHFILNAIVTTLLGWEIAITMSITIEFTQADAVINGHYFSWPDLKGGAKKLCTKDTFWDLIADALGILAGQWLRIKLLSGL